MAKKPNKWIQKANLDAGALTKKAENAGFSSWEGYCAQPDLSAKSERQCNLAKTFKNMANSRKKK